MKAQAHHVICIVHVQGRDVCVGQHPHACHINRMVQACHQTCTCFFGDGMHAVHAVSWVQETIQYVPWNAMVLREEIDSRANGLAVGLNQNIARAAMGFVLNILCKHLCRIFNVLCVLCLRARRGNEAR